MSCLLQLKKRVKKLETHLGNGCFTESVLYFRFSFQNCMVFNKIKLQNIVICVKVAKGFKKTQAKKNHVLFQFKTKDISTCIKAAKTECYEKHYNCVCTRCGFHKPLIHV